MKLDKYDKAILNLMQQNSKISNIKLSQKINLSPSATLRRVQALEKAKVIESYGINVDSSVINAGLQVIIRVSLNGQGSHKLEEFENSILRIAQVVNCYLIAGDYDYMVQLSVKDIEHYEKLHKTALSKLPHVSRLQSNFALREVVKRAIIIN